MQHFIRLAFTVCALFLPVHAFGAVEVGQALPHMLELADQNGNQQSFDALKGENGLVLVFVRSTEWCPYCQTQLIALNARIPEITDQGYALAAISYDPVDMQRAFAEKNNITFPLLSDAGSNAIRAFGILNTDMQEGTKYFGIPHPTIYVVDGAGTIKAILAKDSYKDRPDIEDIIDALN